LSYRLKKSESAADGLVRVVVERIDHALELLRESGREDHEKAVHTVRKDLKKARSAVRLARSGIGEKRYRRANVRLGDAGRRLSAARDATVKKQTLEALRHQFEADLDTTAAEAITSAVAALDPATVSPAAEVERSMSEVADELELVRSSIMEWEFEVGGWRLVADGLDRTYRRGRNALADVSAGPSAEHVHAWRKRIKDLWYQLRLLEKVWPAMIGGLTSESHELAELVGDHHDLALLTDELEGTSLTLTPPQRDALRELVERRQTELLGQALPLGGRVYAEQPKAFSRRHHTYWRIWRA